MKPQKRAARQPNPIRTLHRALILILLPVSFDPLLTAAASSIVVGWGDGTAGQAIGVSRLGCTTGLVTVAGHPLTNITAIAAGTYHALALRADGTVFGWGENAGGKAVGFKTQCDITNGIVKIAGKPLTNITALAAGPNQSLALTVDGSVIVWGEMNNGQRWAAPQGLKNVVAVAAGWNHCLAIKKDGTIVEWGTQRVPAGLSNIIAIAAGHGVYDSELALRRDGTVVRWGPSGEILNVPAGLTNVTSIASAGGHFLTLSSDGTVFGWGDNNVGQATGAANRIPPYYSEGSITLSGRILTNVVAISARQQYSLALRHDGSIVGWGSNPYKLPEISAGLTNVMAISAGENFCLAIQENGASPAR